MQEKAGKEFGIEILIFWPPFLIAQTKKLQICLWTFDVETSYFDKEHSQNVPACSNHSSIDKLAMRMSEEGQYSVPVIHPIVQ